MTKSTWRNIYNFGSESVSENSFDINDIASSVSETTNSERISRNNIDKIINISGGNIKEDEEVPLVWELNEQSGGNIDADEFVSTEQLENKLRDIFTGLDENVAAPVTQQGGELTDEEKEDLLNMHTETQELITAGQDMLKELISSESQDIKKEVKDLVNLKLEHQSDNIKMNQETQELITAGNDMIMESIKDLKGSGGCGEETEGAPLPDMEGGNDETIPLLLSKLLEDTGTNNVNEDVVTSDIDETLTLSEATYYSDAGTLSSIIN